MKIINLNIAIILAGSLISLTSCTTDKNVVYEQRPIEFSGAEKSFVDTTYFDNMKVIKLEANKKSVIRNMAKVFDIDGKLYVFDSILDQIIIFDRNGKHQGTINRKGHGKGEYVRLVDVAYDKEKKELLCLVDPSSIMHYTINGDYIKTDKLDGYYTDISCNNSYIYLYRATYADKKTPEYTLTCINNNTGNKTELLPFSEEYAPFCSIGSKMFANGTDVTFVRKFDNNIYHVSDAAIDSSWVLNMNSFAFPKSKLTKKYECSEIYDLCKKNNYIYMLSNIVKGHEYVLFSSNLYGIHVASPISGKCRNYTNMNVTKYNIPVKVFVPFEGINSKCAFILYPSSVMNLKEMRERNPMIMKSINRAFFDDMKDITEESNPILFVYDLK